MQSHKRLLGTKSLKQWFSTFGRWRNQLKKQCNFSDNLCFCFFTLDDIILYLCKVNPQIPQAVSKAENICHSLLLTFHAQVKIFGHTYKSRYNNFVQIIKDFCFMFTKGSQNLRNVLSGLIEEEALSSKEIICFLKQHSQQEDEKEVQLFNRGFFCCYLTHCC